MNPDVLRETLVELKRATPPEYWYNSLNERKRAELEFHNRDRDPQSDGTQEAGDNKKYYSTTDQSRSFARNWIRTNCPGKVFLDYACGNGSNAILAAQAGASLSIGLDISDISVSNGELQASNLGLKNCIFVQGDCENTGLPDESVDLVICSGMLHHLDLNFAYPELRRILKPGGRILAKEALNYNPLIKLYRMLTPSLRTDWEKRHILSMKDVRMAKKFFRVRNIKFWHITSYFAAYLKAFPQLMDPAVKILNGIDSVLTKIPGVRLLAWQFTFELIKDPKSEVAN